MRAPDKSSPDTSSSPNTVGISDPSRGFGDFLIKAGLIDQQVLDRASRAATAMEERFDRVLTKLGLLSDADRTEALAKYLDIPIVSHVPQEPILIDLINIDFVRRNKVLPLSMENGQLSVGVVDPFSEEPIQAVAYLTDLAVAVHLFQPAEFEKVFEILYESGIAGSKSVTDQNPGEANELDVQRLRDLASEAPTIRLVNQIVADAVESRASDIHIEPTVDAVLVRYRIDGILRTAQTLSAGVRAAITSRIKIISRLDIAERRLPQDGRTKIAFRGVDIDFRVSTIPTAFGESVVMRILDRSRVQLDFERLGFQKTHVATFRTLLKHPDGIILVTGPTGSGKTTTLYTALKILNSSETKLFTVEDPIEYQLAGVNQVQVHSGIGLTFPAALRSILRQDPDMIMIGEIRDLETAQIAIQASLTGHLVLSTLHTNSAASTVARLIDMGIENYLLASTLRAVIAQRLVRRLCDHCSAPHENAGIWADEIKRTVSGAELNGRQNIRQKQGCKECGDTGFLGRLTIAEVLLVDSTIQNLILSKCSDAKIDLGAREGGMISMYEDGIMKVWNGETTIEEVMRVTRGG